jgi:hypothetical protein
MGRANLSMANLEHMARASPCLNETPASAVSCGQQFLTRYRHCFRLLRRRKAVRWREPAVREEELFRHADLLPYSNGTSLSCAMTG